MNKKIIFLILLLIISNFGLIGLNVYLIQNIPDKENTDLIVFDIRSSLRVIYNNDSIVFFELELKLNLVTEKLSRYDFSLNDLFISSNPEMLDFKFVNIFFYIPEIAMKYYNEHLSTWTIEESEKTLSSDRYFNSSEGIPFLIGSEDITNQFWRVKPPNEIKSTVTLTN